jgi:N-methylhydantoinase B
MAGGLNGGGCNLIINQGSDKEFNAGMYATGVELKKGDRIFYASSGGGGFGNPLDRDPNLVLDDVMDEWLTAETARKYYGVAIDIVDAEALDYRINEKETERLRAELRKKGFEEGRGSHQLHPLTKDLKLDWTPTVEEVQPHITVSRPPGW